MNKPLRRVAVFCLVLIAALMIRVNYVQVVKADEYANAKKNQRALYDIYSHPRGDFLVDNKPITGSKKTDGKRLVYERTYLDGPKYAPITGHAAPFFGNSLLENLNNKILTGDDSRLFVRRTLDTITGKEKRGGNVALTINGKAQDEGYKAMQGKTGAAVAIDPVTGKILAMISTPSYNPADVSVNDNNAEGKAISALEKDPAKPMLNRPIRQTYAPGSTFKLITAAAALSSGKYQPDTRTPFNSPIQLPLTTTDLGNEGNDAQCTQATLQRALELSCNATFAGLGNEIGAAELQKQAEAFGFNNFSKGPDDKNDLLIPTRVDDSIFPTGLDQAQTMMSSIGQFSVTSTPMQMAMVVAAIENDGKLMQPYLVDELRNQNLSTIEKTSSKEIGRPISSEVASQLRDMMQGVVENGSGKNAKIDGVKVGGKTGTAQQGENNSKNPYAWFVSYAEANGKKVAVAVVIEDSDAKRAEISGGGLAAPVAKAIMQAVVGK